MHARWTGAAAALLALALLSAAAGGHASSRLSRSAGAALAPTAAAEEHDSMEMAVVGGGAAQGSGGGGAAAAPSVAPPNDTGTDPFSHDCMHVPFSLCVGSVTTGVSVVAGVQPPKGLVGSWDFENVGAQDASGLMHAMAPAPAAGPGFLSGASAYLDGKAVPRVRHHPQYDSASFSVEFALFMIQDSVDGDLQTLFHKGRREGDQIVAAPSLQLWPDSRRLKVSVSTSPRHKVAVDSRGGVPLRRWTHVAVVVDGRILQIFFNGVLDTEFLLPAPMMPNEDPIYVGNDPWLGNGPVAYLDELRIYRRGLTSEEVQAAGSNAFPGLGSRNIRLGCGNCARAEARASCPEYYRLCERDELRGGGLTMARAMDWIDSSSVVWEADDGGAAEDGTGVGLCCRGKDAM